MEAESPLSTAPQSIEARGAPVWDLPIRLFHWILVGLIAFSWWSGEKHDMEWHRLSGLRHPGAADLSHLLGLVGGRTARFTQFVRGPRAILAYLRTLFSGPHEATART